jgi:hypothetical protein
MGQICIYIVLFLEIGKICKYLAIRSFKQNRLQSAIANVLTSWRANMCNFFKHDGSLRILT